MSQIEERLLENSCYWGQSIASKENFESVMEEDESYTISATHSGTTLPAAEKVLSVQRTYEFPVEPWKWAHEPSLSYLTTRMRIFVFFTPLVVR